MKRSNVLVLATALALTGALAAEAGAAATKAGARAAPPALSVSGQGGSLSGSIGKRSTRPERSRADPCARPQRRRRRARLRRGRRPHGQGHPGRHRSRPPEVQRSCPPTHSRPGRRLRARLGRRWRQGHRRARQHRQHSPVGGRRGPHPRPRAGQLMSTRATRGHALAATPLAQPARAGGHPARSEERPRVARLSRPVLQAGGASSTRRARPARPRRSNRARGPTEGRRNPGVGHRLYKRHACG